VGGLECWFSNALVFSTTIHVGFVVGFDGWVCFGLKRHLRLLCFTGGLMVREPLSLLAGWFIHYSKNMWLNLFRRVSDSLECLRPFTCYFFAIFFRALCLVC